MEIALLVPVKAFHAAKGRMRGTLTGAQRIELARWLATRVVQSAGVPVFVACDDDEVASWAGALGADVLWGPDLGLNGAVDQGVDMIADKGFDHVIVCHGDLPLVASRSNGAADTEVGSLRELVVADTVVLVPDRRLDGTNVLARPTAIDFPAQYGRASFSLHYAAALATGCAVEVRIDPDLSVDLDRVADCLHPRVAPLLAADLPDVSAALTAPPDHTTQVNPTPPNPS